MREELRNEVDSMLEMGVVGPSTSSYALVGSLSAKKWLVKSTKLAGMVGKGLRSNFFNGSKMAIHYFVFCAPFSKLRLFALSRVMLSP